MRQIIHFPKIIVTKISKGFDGLVGLKLKSILKGDLLIPQYALSEEKTPYFNRLDPRRQQQDREDLLHAISSWPANLTLELHLTTMPDLIHKARGRILITLFIRCVASTEEKVKEEIISRYLNLMPLLSAHLSEAEFSPIYNEKELDLRMAPFRPTDALAIHRRQENLSLSTPFLKRLSVGFGPVVVKDVEGNNVVNHLYPWVPSLDDWSKLMDALMGQLDPIQIIVRLRSSATYNNAWDRLTGSIQTCAFLSGCKEHHVTLNRQASILRDVSVSQMAKFREGSFDLGVFILAPHSADRSLGNLMGKAITGLNIGADQGSLFLGGFACRKIEINDALKADYFPEKEPFTLSEAACAFRLPSPPMQDHPGLPIKRSRTSLAILPFTKSRNGAIELVINEHQGMVQPVVVGTEDRMRHTFIIGQTGTGKSTLMESMILQDIRAGRGLAVIDPHGELVESILGRIPSERANDVILFDLLDREMPLGFNLIQWRTIEERDLIIDEIYLSLDRTYDMKSTGGPIFESNFRGMLKLLMGERSRGNFVPTLLEFTSCYLNRDFRDWLKNLIENPQTLDFIKELERTGGDASLQNLSPCITSKFSRFINDTTLMRIVGQERTSFDFDVIMNERKIFLVNLGKGRFGATVSALIANQIVARFKLAAMKREGMPPEERRDFFLYVDECHNLPGENFMELLGEARKFKIGLVLVAQHTSQLTNTGAKVNDLLSAILGNVGTILTFRLGQEDAVRLAPVLHPYFSSLDILGLPNWQGYAHMQLNGESTPPFSFRTKKDETPYNEQLAIKIKNLSRLKYGTDCNMVDAQILRRRSVWKGDEVPF